MHQVKWYSLKRVRIEAWQSGLFIKLVQKKKKKGVKECKFPSKFAVFVIDSLLIEDTEAQRETRKRVSSN